MRKKREKVYEKYQEISLHSEDSQRKINLNTPEDPTDDSTFIPFIDNLSELDFFCDCHCKKKIVVNVDVHPEPVAYKKSFCQTHL